MVSGSEVVCWSAGQSPRTVRATSAPAQDGTGVETEVVLHPLVCRCSIVCHVSTWLKGTIGADGHAPMPHEVECDHQFAALD